MFFLEYIYGEMVLMSFLPVAVVMLDHDGYLLCNPFSDVQFFTHIAKVRSDRGADARR